MPKLSAGILPYRVEEDGSLSVLLVHPGGPFWKNKDEHAWSIPKGEYGPDEDPEQAAAREFTEELGLPVPEGPWLDLGTIRQSGGKYVRAWAVRADTLQLDGMVEQSIRNGMASPLGQDAAVPRSRPRRMDDPAPSTRPSRGGAGRIPGQIRYGGGAAVAVISSGRRSANWFLPLCLASYMAASAVCRTASRAEIGSCRRRVGDADADGNLMDGCRYVVGHAESVDDSPGHVDRQRPDVDSPRRVGTLRAPRVVDLFEPVEVAVEAGDTDRRRSSAVYGLPGLFRGCHCAAAPCRRSTRLESATRRWRCGR